MRRRAFTLVEVLITVATIAVLVSIAIPALSKVRVAVRESRCEINLRSIRQGIAVYESANWCLPDAPLTILDPDTWTTTNNLERRIAIGWSEVYFCPSTQGIKNHPDRSSYLYGIGGTLIGSGGGLVDFRKQTIMREHGGKIADVGYLSEASKNHRGGLYVYNDKGPAWFKPSAPYPNEDD